MHAEISSRFVHSTTVLESLTIAKVEGVEKVPFFPDSKDEGAQAQVGQHDEQHDAERHVCVSQPLSHPLAEHAQLGVQRRLDTSASTIVSC